MMDALRFIFSSFWIWLGFTTLVAVVLKYLVDADQSYPQHTEREDLHLREREPHRGD